MKLDTGLSTRNLRDVPAAARAAEAAGFDAIWIPEAGNDGFLPAALIAEHTGQPADRVEQDSLRDRWFTAAEARDYGIVDHIVQRLDEVLPAPTSRTAGL